MATRYTYAASVTLGDDFDTEAEIEVTYSVAWGSPETGRGYMADPYRYDPGAPDVVECVQLVAINGEPVNVYPPEFAAQALAEIETNHTEAMLEEARHEDAAWDE